MVSKVDLVANVNGSLPHSLTEAAPNVTRHIADEQKGFRNQIEAVLIGKEAVHVMETETQRIVGEGLHDIEEFMEWMVEHGGQQREKAVSQLFSQEQKRESELFTIEFAAVAAFFRSMTELLEESVQSREGVTSFERHSRVREKLSKMPKGDVIMKQFGDDMLALVSKPYNEAEHDALRARVLAYTSGLGSKTGEPVIKTEEVRNMFVLLAVALNPEKMELFTAASIHGLIGRVLPEDKMKAVFGGDPKPIEDLPAGGIRLAFADGEISFYHEGPGSTVPDAVKKKMDPAKDPAAKSVQIPRKILFVHYHTDDDMRELIHDMSDGEVIVANRRGVDGKTVEFEGMSTGPSDPKELPQCKLADSSSDINQKDLIAKPMKYISNDFEVRLPMTAKTVA